MLKDLLKSNSEFQRGLKLTLRTHFDWADGDEPDLWVEDRIGEFTEKDGGGNDMEATTA